MKPPPLPSTFTPPVPPPKNEKKSTHTLIIVLAVLVGAFIFGGGLLAAILIPTVGKVRETARRTMDGSNLRQVVQAALISANDHNGHLPPPAGTSATIHNVAAQLAREGGLNDASAWFAANQSTTSPSGPVWDENSGAISPAFAAQSALAWDYATGITTAMSSTTPIAWTRGLRTDGTWGPDGVYGTDGGHIAFLGGNVAFFRDTKAASLVRTSDGGATNNILEALPPTARVVGSGPGTLNGSRGARDN